MADYREPPQPSLQTTEVHNLIVTPTVRIHSLASRAIYIYFLVTWVVLGLTAWLQETWWTPDTKCLRTDCSHLAVSLGASWASTGLTTYAVSHVTYIFDDWEHTVEGMAIEQALYALWKVGLIAFYWFLTSTNRRLAKKAHSHEIPIIQFSAHDDVSVDVNNDHKKKKYGESLRQGICASTYNLIEVLLNRKS